VKRMIQRSVTRADVEKVILSGEIIEEYPDDKYSASCLIYGKTEAGRDLHVQVTHAPTVVVITVYEPDPKEWVACRTRR
jgi:hypothetical protein